MSEDNYHKAEIDNYIRSLSAMITIYLRKFQIIECSIRSYMERFISQLYIAVLCISYTIIPQNEYGIVFYIRPRQGNHMSGWGIVYLPHKTNQIFCNQHTVRVATVSFQCIPFQCCRELQQQS